MVGKGGLPPLVFLALVNRSGGKPTFLTCKSASVRSTSTARCPRGGKPTFLTCKFAPSAVAFNDSHSVIIFRTDCCSLRGSDIE